MNEKLLKNLISNAIDTIDKLSKITGQIIANIPDEKRGDGLFDFIDNLKDQGFDSVDDAYKQLVDSLEINC